MAAVWACAMRSSTTRHLAGVHPEEDMFPKHGHMPGCQQQHRAPAAALFYQNNSELTVALNALTIGRSASYPRLKDST